MMGRGFNKILSECIDALLAGESLEQCLQRYPQHAGRLGPLLRAVMDAREASHSIQPPPELKVRVTEQVRARMEARQRRLRANRISFFDWMPQWVSMGIIAVLTVVFCGGCVFAASSGSVPGEILYPVKLAFEDIQLAFTFSDSGKADLHAELASRRVTEMERMAPDIDSQSVEVLTSDLKEHLQEVEQLAVVIAQEEQKQNGDGELEQLEQNLRRNYFKDTDLTVSAEAKAPADSKDDIAGARVTMWTSYKAVFNTIEMQRGVGQPAVPTPTPTSTTNASINATATPEAYVNTSQP
jgi:hypothetical protein